MGLPRTGTSVLSLLLGLDPVARPLLQWEAAHPIPPPTPGGGGGGPPHRPDGQGPRRADEAQPAAQGHAPLRRHPGRGVRLALHVRRPHARARDPGPRAVLRPLAGAGRHDARLRPAPPRPPDPAVAPADRAVDPQDAESPVAPRRHARRLSRRQGHLDPPGPGAGRHLAGQPGQRGPAPPDQSARPAPDRRGVEAQVRLRPALGDGLRREGRRPAGASTCTTTT